MYAAACLMQEVAGTSSGERQCRIPAQAAERCKAGYRTGHAAGEGDGSYVAMGSCEGYQGADEQRPEL